MIGFVAPFEILNHLDRLKIVKETSNEYHCLCPVCGDGGFKVNKKNGSYQAFKCGCEVKEIREAIRPWSEVAGELLVQGRKGAGVQRRNGYRRSSPSPHQPSPSAQIKLATLPDIPENIPVSESGKIPQWLQSQGVPPTAEETRYWYSKTQWISRFEWTTEKGKEKTIRQGNIKSNGLIEWKKGSKDWKAYRLGEAAKHCSDQWVLAVEGEGCVETARRRAIAAITWQGSNWQISRIMKDVTKLKESGAKGIVYFPDNDETGEKKGSLVAIACKRVNLPCVIISPTDVWNEMPHKGDIRDWVEAHSDLSTKKLISQLDSAIARSEASERGSVGDNHFSSAPLPSWSQSDIALWLAKKYHSQLAWNTQEQEWYRYSSVTPGIWSIEPVEFVGVLVNSEIERLAQLIAESNYKKKKPSYTISMINGVIALLKMNLAMRKWNSSTGVLPLLNGVLDLETKKLLPHSPENKLTWCLPYEYNLLATCEPITEWLLTMCGGDRQLVELLRAYLLGIVTGRTDWQKYLELIGAGGTGKSTFTRLAIALVGVENVHTTTLQKLEKCKFEAASIAGKRLVLINDSERYAGDVIKLKNLTGQDTLPYEVKFKQSRGGFNPEALVIITTNEVIQSSDYTSGLARRRISIPMSHQIKSDRQKHLIEHRNGQMRGEFLPYIPGLLNWVLAMDEIEATEIVKNYEIKVPSLLAMKARTLVETNPIADWLDNYIVYDISAKTNVGVAKRDKDSNSPFWYLDTDKWLYPNYCEYCHNSGTRPVSLRRFVTLLSDLGTNQLGLEISRERDRYGSYFVGLKIRNRDESSPPMITGNKFVVKNITAETRTTNVISNLWRMVMDRVMEVMEYVMDESIDSDGCDGCDGKIEKSNELVNNVENEDTLGEVSSPTRAVRSVECKKKNEESLEASERLIKIGDKVTIDECPGHWAWASPFVVEKISGEMVKLEMVSELVEIAKLKIDG